MEKNLIQGKTVILRGLREADAAFFARWYNEPQTMFQCGFHERTTVEDERERILAPEADDREWYAITDMSGRLLGETGLLRIWPHWRCTDMSVIIPDPDDQGKGYGSEAGRLILERAFQHHGMNRVAVGVVAQNTGALRFWERLGFVKEGIQEQGYYHEGAFSDFVMMRVLRGEWLRAKK